MKTTSITTGMFFGDAYRMTVMFDDNKSYEENLAFLKDIRSYVKQMDGHIQGSYYDSLVFTIDDEKGAHWWCSVYPSGDAFTLEVIKEEEIHMDETLHIKTSDYPDGVCYFTSYSDGVTYQTIVGDVDEGIYTIDVYSDLSYGAYTRSYSFNDEVHSEKGKKFVFDNVMFDEGVYYWEVAWRDDEDPGDIYVSLIDSGDIPYVKMGEELGAIKVSTSSAESINVTPTGQSNLFIDHPEVDSGGFYLDKTPDGDYLIYVPSGMWDVDIIPRGDALLSNYKTLMVPVSSGEVTTIKVPLQYEQLLSQEEENKGMEGLVMEDLVESGNNVSFNFTLVDREAKEILPDLSNTEIFEGGIKTSIKSIERIDTPPSVVLLLDSSGSMKGQMTQTLDAARTFISSLPEDTYLKVIDFDTKPTVLDGSSVSGGLDSLGQIKVGGATALYDSVIKGYELLEGKSRPTLVVFTDGTDANYNDTAAGSVASYEEVLEVVDDNDISMYTIGFGEGHDASTLMDLATNSAGLYYSAEDDSALYEVFEAINNKLSNSFKAIYERPKQMSPSDVPMISFVIDISGSMYSDDNDACGWRLDDVKNVFHDFVQDLPDEAQLQLMTFNSSVQIEQSSTTDKTRILRGLGDLFAAGGTEILTSIVAGYETLDMMPTTNKVLVYLTDAALGVDSSDKEMFDETLEEMKEKNMNVLWVGLGMEEDSPEFVYAAEKIRRPICGIRRC